MSSPAEEEVLLQRLTRREFRERMLSGALHGCLIPVAAIEQHLEHLAMEHDWCSVSVVAERVARRLAPRVLVANALMAGISEHHMSHPGTLTLRPASFLAVLNDTIRSVIHAGFANIVVLNGHGGNIVPCQAVWDQFVREFQVNLHFLSYWDVLTADDAEALLRGGKRLPDDLPGHAQEFETSIALAAFPENVRTNMWTDQADQSPSLATADAGRQFLERITDRLAERVRAIIDRDDIAPVPAFFP